MCCLTPQANCGIVYQGLRSNQGTDMGGEAGLHNSKQGINVRDVADATVDSGNDIGVFSVCLVVVLMH